MNEELESISQFFAEALSHAEGLLIGAGAGMGVDSGLPDFRGTSGFWKAYPPLAKLGIQFEDMANLRWFKESPNWHGGFGHRLNLYRMTEPHYGFSSSQMDKGTKPVLLRLHLQRRRTFSTIRFSEDSVTECHGSLPHLQCVDQCGQEIWPVLRTCGSKLTEIFTPSIPCPPAALRRTRRPNILMFSDWEWDPRRTNEQGIRLNEWLAEKENSKLCLIELGAGPNIPTVRTTCEQAWQSSGGTFLRINPRDHQVPEGAFSLAMGAKEALQTIEEFRKEE